MIQSRRLMAFPLALLVLAPLPTAALPTRTQPQTPRNWTTVWGWATASWGGDDRPYRQIRATIDNASSGGRKPQELMDFYETAARKAPNDPEAQFRWAYAAYKAALTVNYNTGERLLGDPRDALVLAPFPHSYEYARLIFLTEDYAVMLVYQLTPVGKRLLRRNPNDYEVKYGTARDLMFSRNPADRQLALKYIEELIRERPERPHPRELLGLFYYQRWQVSRSRDDAGRAIAAYQQYLQCAPAMEKEGNIAQQVRENIAQMQRG